MKNTLLFIYSTNILVCLLNVNMKNTLTPKMPLIRKYLLTFGIRVTLQAAKLLSVQSMEALRI